MLDPAAYEGREQTYVKHFVLEKYLERVTYNIFSFQNHFAYVDGFSGPWKPANERYEDTSFKIATDALLKVQKGLKDDHGKQLDSNVYSLRRIERPMRSLKRLLLISMPLISRSLMVHLKKALTEYASSQRTPSR